jgi:anti-anti-sigma regulatory factor
MEIQANERGVLLNLGTSITFNSINENMRILKKVIELNQEIFLEGKHIDKIDSSGLQLLVMFIITMNQNKIRYSWEGSSTTLINSAKLLGMDSILGLVER